MQFSDLETYFIVLHSINPRSSYWGMDSGNAFEGETVWKDLFLIDGLWKNAKCPQKPLEKVIFLMERWHR